LSFPLVGNPSVSKERFSARVDSDWTSQNDRIEDLKKLLRSLRTNNINVSIKLALIVTESFYLFQSFFVAF